MGRFSDVRTGWANYRPSKGAWFWSCVACVIATMIVGFAWGGWVTATSARAQTTQAVEKARADLAADYCVSRFDAAPDAAAKLADLKKAASWDRGDFIDKGGWAKLPGLNESIDGAADLCADRLINAKMTTAKSATTS